MVSATIEFLNNVAIDIKKNIKPAQLKTLEKIIKDTDEYVPYKTGELANNVEASVESDVGKINYLVPYASYAFYPIAPSGVPKQYTKTVHTKAQGYPLDKSAEEHEEEWLKYFKEVLLNGIE